MPFGDIPSTYFYFKKQMEALFIKNDIHINAPIEMVWDCLTQAKYTQQYMFGCSTVSEWQEGSTLLWKMNHEGVEIVAVKGTVIKIEPPQYLEYTVIDPNDQNIPDIPENYLTVTYHLKKTEHGTQLFVTQGDYSKVADGQNRFDHSNNDGEGWMPILSQIKEICEK